MSESVPNSIAAPFAQTMAQVCQLYGIPTKFGQLYGLLFLSPEPLSLAQLAEQGGSAKSTTSVALRKLERYRFVRRLPRGSDRRDFYEAVVDPMQILKDWARLFLAPEMALGHSMVDQLDAGLDASVERGELDPQAFETLRARTEIMRQSLGQGMHLLAMLGQLDGPNTPEPA